MPTSHSVVVVVRILMVMSHWGGHALFSWSSSSSLYVFSVSLLSLSLDYLSSWQGAPVLRNAGTVCPYTSETSALTTYS